MAKIIVITTDRAIFEQVSGSGSEDMANAGLILRRARLKALKEVLRDLVDAQRYEDCIDLAKEISRLENGGPEKTMFVCPVDAEISFPMPVHLSGVTPHCETRNKLNSECPFINAGCKGCTFERLEQKQRSQPAGDRVFNSPLRHS